MKGQPSFFPYPISYPRSPSFKTTNISFKDFQSPKSVSVINPALTLTSYKYRLRSLKRGQSPYSGSSKSSASTKRLSFSSPKSEQMNTFVNYSKLYANDSDESFASTNTCLYKSPQLGSPRNKELHDNSSRLEEQLNYITQMIQQQETSGPSLFTTLKDEIINAKNTFKKEIKAIRHDMNEIKSGIMGKINEKEEISTSGSENREFESAYVNQIKKNEKYIEMLKRQNDDLKSKIKGNSFYEESAGRSLLKNKRLRSKLDKIRNSIDKDRDHI